MRVLQVKRLVFKDSLEAQVLKLHTLIKDGEAAIVDGAFPVNALKLFT